MPQLTDAITPRQPPRIVADLKIFTYGTLMIPTVMRAVTGRDFTAQVARLRGYARFRVKDALYPGIIAQPHASIDGIVYVDLDHATLKRLDAFEGGLYRRIHVRVQTNGGKLVTADTYVVKPSFRCRLTATPWSQEEFKQKDMDAFLARYPGFRRLPSRCERTPA